MNCLSVILKLLPTNRYCCRCGIHCLSCPELLPNKDLKVQDKNKKPKRIPSAETAADSELQPKITTSSHTCSNTHVGSSFSSNATKNNYNFHQGFVLVVLLSRSLIVLSISFIRLSASVFVIPLL